MIERYMSRPDRNGNGWCIYDLTTGKIAEPEGAPLSGLPAEEAQDLVKFLNRLEAKRAQHQPDESP